MILDKKERILPYATTKGAYQVIPTNQLHHCWLSSTSSLSLEMTDNEKEEISISLWTLELLTEVDTIGIFVTDLKRQKRLSSLKPRIETLFKTA